MGDAPYRVMCWDAGFDGPWSRAAVERYVAGGFDGLSLLPGADWAPSDLGFLHELTGLRFFSMRSKMRNDLDAFRIGTLEELTLITGSRVPVPDVVQTRLRSLCLADRPGIDVAARWPALESIRLGAWRGVDLRVLDNARSLSSVHMEGRRQAGGLDGIETCGSVQRLTVISYSVRDTTPLRGLANLTELKLLAARPAAPHTVIDLSDLEGTRAQTVWVSNAERLREVAALASIPTLRELRLIDCRISPMDQRALNALPHRVRVHVVTTH